MIKTITKEICDLCKQEVPTQKHTIPVYRTFDSEEGKLYYSSKQFHDETLDLCEECLEKITLVHSIGVQCEIYEIEEVDKHE